MLVNVEVLKRSFKEHRSSEFEEQILSILKNLGRLEKGYQIRHKINDHFSKKDKVLEKNLYELNVLELELELARLINDNAVYFLTSENPELRSLALVLSKIAKDNTGKDSFTEVGNFLDQLEIYLESKKLKLKKAR